MRTIDPRRSTYQMETDQERLDSNTDFILNKTFSKKKICQKNKGTLILRWGEVLISKKIIYFLCLELNE